MNRIEILEDSRFRFTSWAEMSLLTMDAEDAQVLVSLLEKAGNDLLQTSNQSLMDKGMEIHYKYARLFFKVRKNYLEIIHLLPINAFPLNGNLIYETVEPFYV